MAKSKPKGVPLQPVGTYDDKKPPTNGNTVGPKPGTEAC